MDTRTKQWQSLAGVLFGVLLVAGGTLASTGLPYGAPASEVANFIEGSVTRITLGGALVMLSAAPLLWFVSCLRRRLEGDGDDGQLAGIVSAAGVACAAVVLVAAASLLGTASRANFSQAIDPAGAAASWDLFGNLLGAALPVAMAVLVAATIVAARRSGWFARWAAWVSWVLAAGLLVLPIAWIFAGGAVLWVAAVSVSMAAFRPPQVGVPAARPRTA